MSSRSGRWRRRLAAFLLIPAIAALSLVLMNLAWFDEPLLPELEALRKPKAVALEGNGYPLAMGFLAAEGRDPRAAGVEIIGALRASRDRGEPITIDAEKKRAILGTPLAKEGLEGLLGFHCQARHRFDCANRRIASIASIDLNQPRLVLLFSRYEALLQSQHFIATPEPDWRTPLPPGEIVALGRLRLAMSFRADPTDQFLEKAAQELAFWRLALREGEMLSSKMVALAAIRNTHDFLSTLIRERDLDARDLELLRRAVRPFSREENDIGAAFLADVRTSLLSGEPPIDAPWPMRLLVQENATFNQHFRETIQPQQWRASLDAREYYDRKAYEPLRHEIRLSPKLPYNLGGKLALRQSGWDPHQFVSRVHDEDGRITLILIQAEIEEHPETDVAAIVSSSANRNPYTGEAMDYDPRARTLGFVCLHTAFHPPEPADQCAVALDRERP